HDQNYSVNRGHAQPLHSYRSAGRGSPTTRERCGSVVVGPVSRMRHYAPLTVAASLHTHVPMSMPSTPNLPGAQSPVLSRGYLRALFIALVLHGLIVAWAFIGPFSAESRPD